MDLEELMNLPPLERAALAARLLAERKSRRRIDTYYPDAGPLRRELYPRHLLFFALGKEFKTRCFMAANRVGKTEGAGGYELACHLTNSYPDWWPGVVYSKPVDVWVAGDTTETVRDITQLKLFGPENALGTGMIPGDSIDHIARRPNTNGAIDYALIKTKGGGMSRIGMKSYEQGRKNFQGTEKDIVWLDEEAPSEVRDECLIRLTTTKGHLIETFTPLKGPTPVVLLYMGQGATVYDGDARCMVNDGRVMVQAGWDDVPHIDAEEKERMLREVLPHLRDARSKGIPSLGAGAIYPIPESEIIVPPFEIPAHWPRAYGLDVGWNRTAAMWGAWDRDVDCVYLYAEHYRGQAEPVIHAASIKAKGLWIPGVIDPASRGRSQEDGKKLLDNYRNQQGLDLGLADNAVEAGIYAVWERLSTGRMKVFESCMYWRTEFRVYRRNEKGAIVKENDHAMDATRYLTMSGLKRARTMPLPGGWDMGAPRGEVLDDVMGY